MVTEDMPSDIVTIVVSTGIGVSVIAGVLSGVCYILSQGYTKKRSRDPVLQWHCVVCNYYLRSNKIEAVICQWCEERVCKLRCSKQEFLRGWICYACLKKPSLIQGVVNTIHFYMKKCNKIGGASRLLAENNMNVAGKQENHQIREFIEKLVSTILDGNVDDASILRIYNSKQYNILFKKYHQDLTYAISDLSSALHPSLSNTSNSQTSSAAHTNLKKLIEKLQRDVSNFSNINPSERFPPSQEETERTYEELLATAIVNKVISKCQNLPSTSLASHTKDSAYSSKQDNRQTPTDGDTTSNSSFEEYLHSDSSHDSTNLNSRNSITIQQRIEEIIHSDVEDAVENYFSHSDSPSLIRNSSDSNWYLQKRQFHGTSSPVPVPMLVPNPVTTAKVLIGDKEIDETSDLSDTHTDDDETDGLIIESAFVMTEETPAANNVSDEEISADSGVREDRDDLISTKGKFYDNNIKTDVTIDDENVDDVSLNSLQSNSEQRDAEYSEKFASLPRVVRRSYQPQMRRYGRDYYTRQASLPSGRKKTQEDMDYAWFSKTLPDEDVDVFRANPVTVLADAEFPESNPSGIEQDDEVTKSLTNSESDPSLVNCYDVENSKIYRHDNNGNEVVVKVNSEGLVHEPEDETIDTENSEEKREIIKTEEPQIRLIIENHEENNSNQNKNHQQENQTSPKPLIQKQTSIFEEYNPSNTNKAIVNKKSDNTLIKKIYADPVVRNFALKNRGEQIPVDDTFANKTPETKPVVVEESTFSSSFDTIVSDAEPISNNDFSLEFSDTESVKQISHKNQECEELKEKHLVASRLGEFSKSFPNLAKIHSPTQRRELIIQNNDGAKEGSFHTLPSDGAIHFPTVKELRRLFENTEAMAAQKDKPVHSLTARSIPKLLKDKLKSSQG